LHLDDKLHFVEEPVEIVGHEVKRLKRSQIPLVKVAFDHLRDALSVIFGLSVTQVNSQQMKDNGKIRKDFMDIKENVLKATAVEEIRGIKKLKSVENRGNNGIHGVVMDECRKKDAARNNASESVNVKSERIVTETVNETDEVKEAKKMNKMTIDICKEGSNRLGYVRVLVEINAKKSYLDNVEINYVGEINYVDDLKNVKRTKWVEVEYSLRMTKVIKGEFEKIKDIKVEDDSLACDSPLEVFNCEVSRLSKMDDDLFTYEVEIANIPCDLRVDDDSEHEADDMGFDPSDIAFTEWLGSKFFNYKTMDHYTMKALWIYWIRGDDEVELTDEEFSDNEDEIAEVFRIDTNIFDYETPICSAFNEFNYLLKVDPDLLTKDIIGFKTYDDYKDDWIYEWNKDVPWVDEKPWTDTSVWTEPKPVIL
ncbi:hypothetical protein Tco_0295118, partial [Tanacetum coccineum]